MAKKYGSPDLFDYYVNGKGSGVSSSSPDLFNQYSGLNLTKQLQDDAMKKAKKQQEDEQKKRLQSEIDNLKTRGTAAGVNTVKDNRNGLEKFLNLGQDQGFIKDAFELMGRPFQAMDSAELQSGKNTADLKQQVKDGKITEKQYYDAINKNDLNPDWLKADAKAFMDGLKGKNKVDGSDVMKALGVKNKAGQVVGGLGLDLVQDPMNLAGGAIGKGIGLAAKGTGKVAKAAIQSVDKENRVMEGLSNVADTVKTAFQNNAPEGIKNLKQSIEAQKNMLQEKSIGILNNLVKQHGLQAGDEAAIRMEEALKNDPQLNDFVQKIVDGSNEDAMRLRGGEKQGVITNANGIKGLGTVQTVGNNVEQAVQDMNHIIHNSPKFQNDMTKINAIKDKHTGKVSEIAKKYETTTTANGATTKVNGLDALNNSFEQAHNSLESAGQVAEASMKMKGLNPDEIAQEMAKNHNFDLNGIIANSVKPQSVITKINKLDDVALASAGLDKATLKEMAVDKWNLDKSMGMAAKQKDKLANMLNPVRVEQLAGGAEGTGFKITKTNSTQVAKGLKDRNAFTSKFIESTISDPVAKQKALENLGEQTITLDKIHRDMSGFGEESKVVADQLSKMQGEIVNWGKSLGVDIPTIEGYMRHSLTKEYRDLAMKPNSTGMGKQFGGNKKVINPRDLYGTAQDVNEMMGKKVFETNAYKAMVQGFQKVTNYIATESFVQKVLADPSVVTKVTKDTDISHFLHPETGKLKRGYAELKMSDFKFYKTLDEDAKTIMAVRPNDKFIVDKNVKELMKNYDDLTANESVLHNLLKYTLDPATKMWKGVTLMSTGYHTRNIMGNVFNRAIAGMGADAQAKYDSKATQLIYQYHKKVLPTIASGKPLDAKLSAVQKQVEEFYKSGLRDNAKVKQEMGQFDNKMAKLEDKVNGTKNTKLTPASALVKGATALPKAAVNFNYKVGNAADDIQRFSMYMWAKAEGKANPVAQVKGAMFDYSDLTATEKSFMKRVMPFYTFARKNLPFQIQNFLTQPHKYNNLNKIVNASYNMPNQDGKNVPGFMKDSFSIGNPLHKYEVLKSYLPASDLINFLDSPSNALGQAVSMTAPAIKLPFELSINNGKGYDFFRNQAIQDFKGQKSEGYGGHLPPKLAYALDQMGGKTPDRIAENLVSLFKGGDAETKKTITDYFPSLFTKYDPKKVEMSKLYDERNRLQDLQKKYQQDTGKDWKTITQLKKEQKSVSGYFGF